MGSNFYSWQWQLGFFSRIAKEFGIKLTKKDCRGGIVEK
jgi:hypothetical protein